MKKTAFRVLLLALLLPVTSFSQEVIVADLPEPSFLSMLKEGGYVGILNWSGILLAGLASLPLGITSIVNSLRSTRGSRPLATTLLIWLSAWAFLLGMIGLSLGIIRTFAHVAFVGVEGARGGNYLAMSLADTLYSITAGCYIASVCMLFLLPSLIISHIRNRT